MITFISGLVLGEAVGFLVGAHKFGALLTEAQLVIMELKTKLSKSTTK